MPAMARGFIMMSMLVLLIMAGMAVVIVPPVPAAPPTPSLLPTPAAPQGEAPAQAPRYTGPSRFA